MENKDLDLLLKTLNLKRDNLDEAVKIVKNLILLRDKTCQRNKLEEFKFGEIVIDTKNNEVGFVVGPITLHPETIPKLTFGNSSNLLYLIVTSSITDGGISSFRVRYVNRKSLVSLNLNETFNNTDDDLQNFCNHQCIMECSSECCLWKYKRSK